MTVMYAQQLSRRLCTSTTRPAILRTWRSLVARGHRKMRTRPSILITDNDEHVLLRLEHLLETAGFDTTVTWRVDEAHQLLRQRSYDLIVVGHYPPNLDAARILRQVGAQGRPACIVLHPPERFPFDAEYFYSLGAHAVLSRWGPELAERVRQLFPPAQATST